MTQPTTQPCPAGHESTATDYCDTCGVAMGTPSAATPAPDATGTLPTVDAAVSGGSGGSADPAASPAPAPAAGVCPSCATPNPPNALFCENCGYDFTTGAMPRPVEPRAAPPAASAPPVAENLSPPPADAWVAEIWIDPDWYADQQSTDPLPSPGQPVVARLAHSSVLIGRASRSRGIHPDLDLGSDSGISRRHAQLTTDGSRWFVEDLGSSNGTYVGGALGVLPTRPVAVGQKVEVGSDDRIYLGAWTRIVLRRAAPGEA